jgi:hypothetical protein
MGNAYKILVRKSERKKSFGRPRHRWQCNRKMYLVVSIHVFRCLVVIKCRSQWPRGLRHELASPARTLGLWIRISREGLLSVFVYSVFVLFFV